MKGIQIALALALMAVPVAATAGESAQTVPFEPHNGAFVIPVVLNDVLTEKFIVDSGATDVSIPAEIAAKLKEMGAMSGADYLGSKIYMLADGSKVPSDIYKIASLRIGAMVVHDVTVRISAARSDLLLGQSFLGRLKSWSMDNTRRVMILN